MIDIINLPTEPPEPDRYFKCEGIMCGRYYNVDVIHILEENGYEFNGLCHHCMDYDGDIDRVVFKECMDNES